MKIIVVGGVAGGMSAATRLRRLDENAEIIVLERGPHVSYANCGLPYHIASCVRDVANFPPAHLWSSTARWACADTPRPGS